MLIIGYLSETLAQRLGKIDSRLFTKANKRTKDRIAFITPSKGDYHQS
ncbi:hypothetical protein DB41_IB00430 [Neochlamydia sp. TUME1]|nr:hypothetical protein DB41_IB00430 [Neochlamydia sp. TUME1]